MDIAQIQSSSLEIINSTANSNLNIKSDEASESDVSGVIILMLGLLSLSFLFSNIFKKYKISFLNESLIATILGLVAGFFITLTNNTTYKDSINNGYINFFLVILLPVIIFESAYTVKRDEFIKHSGSILIYAVFGTMISVVIITIASVLFSHYQLFGINFKLSESIAFGSLISPTDPVSVLAAFKDFTIDPNFFQLIYGESIMNDAVSIVFFESSIVLDNDKHIAIEILITLGRFFLVFIGSILLGFVTGYLTALILRIFSVKNVENMRHIEIGLVLIVPWISYLLASIFKLSAIVCILFNGLAQSTYTKPNLSEFSRIVSLI